MMCPMFNIGLFDMIRTKKNDFSQGWGPVLESGMN